MLFCKHVGLFFGSSSDKYSSEAKSLPKDVIIRIVSHTKISSLDQDEAVAAQMALINSPSRRDGNMSLRQMHETLKKVRFGKGKPLSSSDVDGIMKSFKKYFEK